MNFETDIEDYWCHLDGYNEIHRHIDILKNSLEGGHIMSEEETVAFNSMLNTLEEIVQGEYSYVQSRMKAKNCLKVVSVLMKDYEIKRNLWAKQQQAEH